MTDLELIQLVQEKAPEELSVGEIERIRDRLEHSSELRNILFEQLRMEEYLGVALGRVEVSVAEIYRRAAVLDKPENRLSALMGWTLCAGLGLAVLAGLIWIVPRDRSVVERDQSAETEEGAETQKAGSSDKAAEVAGRKKPAGDVLPPESVPVRDVPESPVATKMVPAKVVGANPAQSEPKIDWPELDPRTAPLRTVEETAFTELGEPRGLTQGELRRWLVPVSGQNHRYHEGTRNNIAVSGFEGLLKLAAPWPADAVLRLAPFDQHGMAIHFWRGEEGVALHYYHYPRPLWAAFRTTRKGNEPRPATYALIATDNDRYDRSYSGPLDLRHQEGAMVLSRGDVRLLTAPLSGPPAEVYFDKQGWLRTLTMYRGEPMADEPPSAVHDLLVPENPASLTWSTDLPQGATFKSIGQGFVRLASDKTAGPARAFVKLPRAGVCEIIVQLDDVSAGTGLYLGDDSGKPLYLLGVLRDQRTGWPTLGFLKPDAGWFETGVDLNQQPAPYVGAGQWLRIVAGSGCLKAWVSGDGVHWSRALDPQRGLRGRFTHVGLINFKTNADRYVSVRKLLVREFSELSDLAPADLRDNVPESVTATDLTYAVWLERVMETLPAGANPSAWRAACAIRSAGCMPSASLGNPILMGLLEESLSRDVPAERRLGLLRQAAEAFDAWEQPESHRFTQLFERLGWHLLREGHPQPFSLVMRGLMTSPIWTTAQYQAQPEPLAKAELVNLLYREKWTGVRDFSRRLAFWNRASHPDVRWPDFRQRTKNLLEWSDAIAQRAAGDGRRGGAATLPLPANWRHPLVVELSKEGYNTLAELEAALAEDSFGDACQIILSARPELVLGLLPDARDPNLLLSFPQAVAAAMQDHPGLRSTMIEQHGKLGRLRAQQAMTEGNAVALEAVTVQFFGTQAAADAHSWLGDRALASGEFALAVAEYQQGLPSADGDRRNGLMARMRLAAAMMGRDMGEAVTEPVAFRDVKYSPVDFEKLVAEMKQRAGAAGTASLVATGEATLESVKPSRFEVKQRGAWRGDVGQNPGNPNSGDVDWVARQLAVTQAGNVLYIANRFQTAALDLNGGNMLWSQPLGKEQGQTHAWPLVPMRLLVAGDRLFIRRLTKHTPELACLETATGKVRWTTRESLAIASDPLLLQDSLYVFVLSNSSQEGLSQLDLAVVNPQTGDVESQRPVMQLRNSWDRQLSCQALTYGGRLIAVAGGTVFCCDLSGQPMWVNRQTWLPPSQDPLTHEQTRSVPLVDGRRVFVVQHGVWSVECLDADSGRRIWMKPASDVRRVLGLTAGRLIVETSRGWQAFVAETGDPAWFHATDQIMDAALCAASGPLMVSRREQIQPELWRALLVWLDPLTGRELATAPLESMTDRQPFLGPVVRHNDRLWTFFGRNIRDPNRDIYELIPNGGTPLAGRPPLEGLDYWVPLAIDPLLQSAAAEYLPGWTCFGGAPDNRAGRRAEFQGQKNVLATFGTPDRPLVFTREVTFAKDTRPRLVLQAGLEGSEKWSIDVRVAGRSVFAKPVDSQTTSNGWGQWEADLSEFAGRTVRLVVEEQHKEKPTLGFWKRLDLVE